MKANLKKILIIVPLIIFMWAWNTYADLPAAARTAPTSTNSHSLSAELADSSADYPKIMGGNVLIATEEFNLWPENIKKGVEIYGVTGTYDGGPICEGELSEKGRWCDNQDGTVTDMTTGLIWLKDAGWGGRKPFWADDISKENAHDRASSLHEEAEGAGLSDGSQEGDWRLPTKSELEKLINGDEAINSEDSRLFEDVQPNSYWSSTTNSDKPYNAWDADLFNARVDRYDKTSDFYVWPVRGGQ